MSKKRRKRHVKVKRRKSATRYKGDAPAEKKTAADLHVRIPRGPLFDMMTDRDRKMIELIVKYQNIEDVAKEMGVHGSSISQRLWRLKKRYLEAKGFVEAMDRAKLLMPSKRYFLETGTVAA